MINVFFHNTYSYIIYPSSRRPPRRPRRILMNFFALKCVYWSKSIVYYIIIVPTMCDPRKVSSSGLLYIVTAANDEPTLTIILYQRTVYTCQTITAATAALMASLCCVIWPCTRVYNIMYVVCETLMQLLLHSVQAKPFKDDCSFFLFFV